MKRLILVGALIGAFGGISNAKTYFQGSVSMTSYSSTVGQTDSSPFVTATGTRVRTGVVAVSRDLRPYYGKKLQILSVYGSGCGARKILPSSRIYQIEDTMASRFSRKIDIWVPTRSQARTIGACTAVIRIFD